MINYVTELENYLLMTEGPAKLKTLENFQAKDGREQGLIDYYEYYYLRGVPKHTLKEIYDKIFN